MSVQPRPHAGFQFSSYEEFKWSMHSRIVQQMASQALSSPSLKAEQIVQHFIEKSPPLEAIQKQLKDSGIRSFKPLYRAGDPKKFAEKLEKIFLQTQEQLCNIVDPETLSLHLMTNSDRHEMESQLKRYRKVDSQIGRVLSCPRTYEQFDHKTPIRLIRPENIPQTLRYYLTAGRAESFFIFNGKERLLPHLEEYRTDEEKTRVLCKWLIGKIERRMPKPHKHIDIECQLATLFKDWELEPIQEQIKESLKKHGSTPKTLKRVLENVQPHVRIQSIQKSVDTKQNPEEVAEEAFQQLQKRIISTDCKKTIPSFLILQYFSFNAFAGGALALREIFPSQKHGQVKGSPTKYHFQLTPADFSVTHVKQFIFFDEGKEDDPIASVEVHWTLKANYGKETSPIGLLSFENFQFHKLDLEARESFYQNISSTSKKGASSPRVIRGPMMRRESKNVLV